MTKYAIQVEGLGKEYIIGSAEQRHDSFREMLTGALTSPLRKLRKLGGTASEEERFWALKDVSFNVDQGEVLGIIGRNGAGKSTLLKVLSRITSPTTGRVVTKGKVASLLEVGTGFHPELTGRENVFLNGAILGMSRQEVSRSFEEIISFAELGQFVDTPVKRYSSGMYVRLAFSVAAHMQPDILLVDEVLAVGDVQFQKRSLGKMENIANGGRCVIFVSHNLAAVQSLCTRALLLDQGRHVFSGAVNEAVSSYENDARHDEGVLLESSFTGVLIGDFRFSEILTIQEGQQAKIIDPLKAFQIRVEGVALRDFSRLELAIGIYRGGFHIASCHDTQCETGLREGRFASVFEFPPDVFKPGRYTLGIGASAAMGDWLWGADIAVMDFSENYGGRPAARVTGVVSVPYNSQRVEIRN